MKKFAEIRTERPFFTLVLLILFGLLLLSVILAVNMGTMDISPSEIFQVVLFRLFGIGDPALYGSGPISDVIWYIRLPRIVLAIAVGMGLSVCGVVMQAVVKNPLADPYILGISSGASLGRHHGDYAWDWSLSGIKFCGNRGVCRGFSHLAGSYDAC